MADNTKVKSLFQWKIRASDSDQPAVETLRVVVLLQADTLREMLTALEADPTASAIAVGKVPVNNLEIVVEAYDPTKVEKSKLTYTKCLQDTTFTTDHVNLV